MLTRFFTCSYRKLLILVPFAIVFFFNTIMFGMVMVALMNTQNPIVKTYHRISRHLSRQNSRHAVRVNRGKF